MRCVKYVQKPASLTIFTFRLFRGRNPAFAVVLSGVYVDDKDAGSIFTYTGMGGVDADTKQQVRLMTLPRSLLLLCPTENVP